MVTYTTLADVTDENLQNVQEWAKTWGNINHEIERFDGEVHEAYAVLGDHDFQFTYEAPDEEAAMKIAVAIERYGLDTQTHQLVDVERMGELTDDI
jgi:uncharacterized protein with GYD domain